MSNWFTTNFHLYPQRAIHITLKLTVRILTTLESSRIHPLLQAIFGNECCGCTDDKSISEEYIKEVLVVCKGLPKDPVCYHKCILTKLYQKVQEADPILKRTIYDHIPSMFYLALLNHRSPKCVDAWCKTFAVTDSVRVHQFVRGLRNQFEKEKSLVELQQIVYGFILSLVRFEFTDRLSLAVQVLDAPVYLDYATQRRFILGFFHRDETWRIQYAKRIAHRFFRCPWMELYRKTRLLHVDLAAFMSMLRHLPTTVNHPTFQTFKAI